MIKFGQSVVLINHDATIGFGLMLPIVLALHVLSFTVLYPESRLPLDAMCKQQTAMERLNLECRIFYYTVKNESELKNYNCLHFPPANLPLCKSPSPLQLIAVYCEVVVFGMSSVVRLAQRWQVVTQGLSAGRAWSAGTSRATRTPRDPRPEWNQWSTSESISPKNENCSFTLENSSFSQLNLLDCIKCYHLM